MAEIPESSLPCVTVAVCVLNGEATIRQCIESLLKLDYPEDKLRIIVIDNGSTDGTQGILAGYSVEVIHESQTGRGYARNRALQVCTDKFIAFTDADCVVDSKWLIQLIPWITEEKTGIAGGRIITPGNSPLALFYESRRIVNNEEFSGNYPFSPPFLATANIILKMEAVEKVGGFNPEYIVAEDADICWRIQDLGYSLRYIKESIVYHHHRVDCRSMFRQSVEYGFDGVVLILKHAHRFSGRSWIWWGLYARWLFSIIRFPFMLLFGPPPGKIFPLYDMIRFSGLIIGRLKAAWKFRIPVL